MVKHASRLALMSMPDASFVDPFKSSVYRGRGSEKGYVQSDYITPEEFARLSKTQAGREEK